MAVALLIVVFGLFTLIYNLVGGPQPNEILLIAKGYIEEHGALVVLFAAFIEGILGINWYFPGSAVLILGVSLTHGNPVRAIELVALISLGFFVAALLNYILGYTLWYKGLGFLGVTRPLKRAQAWFDRRRLVAIYVSFFHPNAGALIATSCGIRHYSTKWFAFHAAVAIMIWNVLWGLIVYHIGFELQRLMDLRLALPLLAVLGGCLVFREWRKQKRASADSNESTE